MGTRWPSVVVLLLLPGYGELPAFLGCDEVVVVVRVFAEVDLDPFDAAVELGISGSVVVADAGAQVGADIGLVVRGEDHRLGPLDPSPAGLLAVDVERDGATLAETAAVIGELHPDLVLPGRDRAVAFD